MDYMSDFPAPDLEQAIHIITNHLETHELCIQKKIDRQSLEKLISIEIESYGGVKQFGSYSGWLYFAFKDIVENTKNTLRK